MTKAESCSRWHDTRMMTFEQLGQVESINTEAWHGTVDSRIVDNTHYGTKEQALVALFHTLTNAGISECEIHEVLSTLRAGREYTMDDLVDDGGYVLRPRLIKALIKGRFKRVEDHQQHSWEIPAEDRRQYDGYVYDNKFEGKGDSYLVFNPRGMKTNSTDSGDSP